MVRITLVCVGKLKEEYLRSGTQEYLKRLSRFAKVEVKELAERATLQEEAESILRACRGRVFALAVEGKQYSSEEFAATLQSSIDRGEEITFVIGSSCGLDGSVKKRADALVSFSRLTFPHQLMRLIFLEQLYRAFMIGSGAEYHK